MIAPNLDELVDVEAANQHTWRNRDMNGNRELEEEEPQPAEAGVMHADLWACRGATSQTPNHEAWYPNAAGGDAAATSRAAGTGYAAARP